MRIGVLRTQVPFVTGGAERHAANLVAALNARGFEAAEITVPFKWYPGEVLADHIMAAKMLDVSEVEGVKVDLTIGLKFPAYLANHPNRLFWVLHQHRQAYDMWDLGTSDLLDDPQGEALRALIHEEDRAAFEASPHPIYANSGNVAGRLEKHLGLASTPLYHPPPNAEVLRQGSYGDYLFVPGRINPSKRLELTLEALAQSKARLVIAGVAENSSYQNHLMKMAEDMGVAGRITWLGAVDDATLIRHYAEARGVVFVPQDEDYGYITLEAMLSGKPVITVTDAGGPLEFISGGVEGLIAEPNATSLAVAFDTLMEDAAAAERMGQAGLARYRAQNISWDHVVETLTGQAGVAVEPTIAPPVTTPEQPSQETALDILRTAIAPPEAPSDLPFNNIEEVLEAYAFDELPAAMGKPEPPIDTGLAGYLGTHWTRFMTTLRQLEGLEITSALDVGVFPPLVFQALLANQFKGIEMHGLWEGPDPYRQSIRARTESHPSFDITLKVANGERDPWPYADNSFDLITGMEILEHLALDPYFFYTEALRVLKPGGHLLITTPNVNSHRGVWKSLNNIAPYSFGIFVPSGGVYGRHNREYAPQELATIGEAAGFETVRLQTLDVYDRHIEPEMAQILRARGDDLSMRGENIQYLAKKTGTPKGVPANLYHGDPTRMHGALSVTTQEATGLTRIAVENTSQSPWPTAGDRATCMLAEWTNGAGELRHQHLMQPLTEPLAPGTTGEIRLPLSSQNKGGQDGPSRHPAPASLPTRRGHLRGPGPCRASDAAVFRGRLPAHGRHGSTAPERPMRRDPTAPVRAMKPVKPRVHWVSPLPNAQTDIAHYTRRILPELAEHTDLILWTDANDWDRALYDFAPVRRLDPDRVTPRDFAMANRKSPGTGPEAVFVNIGNAWPFHAGFLRMVQRIPSVIVLHDMAIQEMCFDAIERDLFPRDLYESSMIRWHGEAAMHAVRDVWAERHTRGAIAQEYPGYELALPQAVSVLTHTPVARDAITQTHDLPVYLRDLPFRPSATAPEYIRSRAGGLRLVQFGYTGPNRRLQNVLEALAPLRNEIDFHLDIFGSIWDPSYIQSRIDALGLRHCVQMHGFVPEADLDDTLSRAHLAFNLRNPTMGEASGSQTRIWNAGVPAVVTDLGWYADLPEGTVFKIDANDEINALQDLIRRMNADPKLGRDIAAKGRLLLETAHAPALYAKHVAEIAARFGTDAAAALRRRCIRSDAHMAKPYT